MKFRFFDRRIAISFIITILLVYFLLKEIDYVNIFKLFKEINYFYILAGIVFYLILIAARALRIKLLTRHKVNMKDLMAIVLVNNLIVNLLPFRAGELFLPVLLKRYSGIEKREGFLMLFYLRTIDTLIIFIFLLIIAIFFSGGFFKLDNITSLLILLIILLITVLLLRGDGFLILLNSFFKKNASNFSKPVTEMTSGLLSVYKFYKSKIITAFIFSLFIFMVVIAISGSILKAYPLNLSYWDILTISFLTVVITSLPINGIASIGTVELGVSTFLISVGINKDAAISVAFNYHLIGILFTIFWGGLGYLYLNFRRK